MIELNLNRSFLISLIIKLIKSVDKSVDKLWISCGWGCGKLALHEPLWIAVDKSGSYPQGRSGYPQNYPHPILRPGQQNWYLSTFSTGPTIITSNLKKFSSRKSLDEKRGKYENHSSKKTTR
jgi:hypothetical protein